MDNSPFGLMDDITSVNKFSYYCGVSYDTINLIIFPLVEPYILTTSTKYFGALHFSLLFKHTFPHLRLFNF